MTTILILAGPSFTVPADFGALIAVEGIGAGGEGGLSSAVSAGGGAYARRAAVAGLSANQVVPLQVGQTGGTDGPGTTPTANTWFKDGATMVAAGAMTPGNASSGSGGLASNSVGDVVFSGGNGGLVNAGAGGGGGGGAGPHGPGNNGADAIGPPGGAGGSGDAGFGGAGGATDNPGRPGQDGTEIGAGAGAGGGAGGGLFYPGPYAYGTSGGPGGNYGGGGTANFYPVVGINPGGQGAIWFKYSAGAPSHPEWLIRARRRGRR